MSVTCFPYGFPTSCSRPPRRADRPWPRCINAGPGTFSHECGAVARLSAPKLMDFRRRFVMLARLMGLRLVDTFGGALWRHCRMQRMHRDTSPLRLFGHVCMKQGKWVNFDGSR